MLEMPLATYVLESFVELRVVESGDREVHVPVRARRRRKKKKVMRPSRYETLVPKGSWFVFSPKLFSGGFRSGPELPLPLGI